MKDRRSFFFLVAAAMALALTPVADPKHRWAPIAVGVVYLLLSLASWLDHRSRQRLGELPAGKDTGAG